jgi:hypothetical protein
MAAGTPTYPPGGHHGGENLPPVQSATWRTTTAARTPLSTPTPTTNGETATRRSANENVSTLAVGVVGIRCRTLSGYKELRAGRRA